MMLHKKSLQKRCLSFARAGLFFMLAQLVLSTNVHAQAGIFEVIHPDVKKGEVELEFLNGFALNSIEDGEERSVHELAVGYGITDSWKLTVALEVANPESESAEVEGYELESLVILPWFKGKGGDHHGHGHHHHDHGDSKDKHSGFTLGLFTALEIPDEGGIDDGALEIGPVFETQLGAFHWVGNLLLEVPFEDDAEPGLAYATQFIYPVNDYFRVGLESFGEFEEVFDNGDEEFVFAGPSIYFKKTLANGHVIEPRLAVLFGLTDESADSILSFNVEYKFGGK